MLGEIAFRYRLMVKVYQDGAALMGAFDCNV
jgi:hypothetical protein